MPDLEENMRRTAANLLKKMFMGRCFDITAVRRAMELQQKPAHGYEVNKLSGLHCVDWEDMPEGMRRQLMHEVLQIVTGENIDLDIFEKAIVGKPKGLTVDAFEVEAEAEVVSVEPEEKPKPRRGFIERLLLGPGEK